MTTVIIGQDVYTLPYRGRFGSQIRRTLHTIRRSKKGIALYAAMNLRGRAKTYEGRYKQAFRRFAEANPLLLREGYPGPRGGMGYWHVPFQERWMPRTPFVVPEGAD